MLVGAPFVEAEQDSSICIKDLPKVIMGRKGSRLTEQRPVPFEAVRHVAYRYDHPRALHRVSLCALILVWTDPQNNEVVATSRLRFDINVVFQLDVRGGAADQDLHLFVLHHEPMLRLVPVRKVGSVEWKRDGLGFIGPEMNPFESP